MREIKFRAWDGMGMHYGGFSVHATGDVFADMVKPRSVMQFTGLHDKNGKEIYDGDILDGHNPKYRQEGGKPSVVKWDEPNACFAIYRGNTPSGYAFSAEVGWSEVIGNSDDTPELLCPHRLCDGSGIRDTGEADNVTEEKCLCVKEDE